VNGETAKRNLEGIVQFHRQRGSRGFHSAAELVAERAKAYGLSDVEILHFPADGKIFYGTQRSRMGWDADKGELTEVRDGKETLVASFAAMSVALAEDSESAEQATDLVDVGNGDSETDYSGKNVKGKIVLVAHQPSSAQELAIGRFGAVGMVSYAPNQTSFTINGVPVSLPGSAQSTALFNADVFSGASVTPGAGGGGTIGFTTRSPSLAWQGVVRAIGASHHGKDIALQAAGTIGQIGVSYSHARNVVSDALDGLSFRDTSGLFYSHDASPSVTGDALQLRYEFSTSNTLLANVVALDSSIPLVCRQWTGAVPCGYGPTNLQHQTLTALQLDDSARLGTSTVDLKVYANRLKDALDQSGYYVDGVNQPSTSLQNSRQSGAIANVSLGLGPKFSLPITLASDSTSVVVGGDAFGPILPSALPRTASLRATTTLPLIDRPHFSLGTDLVFQRFNTATSSTSQTSGSLEATYAFSPRESVSAVFSPGNLGSPTAPFDGVSAPAQLQFVCASNVGVGVGPSSSSSDTRQTMASVAWSLSNVGWSATLSAHRNVQTGGLVGATVNALGLDPSLFAPGYTLASVIANEFTEAVGTTYLSALVEMALVLFVLTLIVNALAGLLVWSVTRGMPARALA